LAWITRRAAGLTVHRTGRTVERPLEVIDIVWTLERGTLSVALFRRNKPPESGPPEDAGNASDWSPQPEKARKWFDHAKAMADSYNYESALVYYANGIKLDPTSMEPHKAMYECAIQYLNRAGKPASSKEIKGVDGAHPVEKFAAAEFAWMKDINNAGLAMDFLKAAAKAGQTEVGQMHAKRALALLLRQKKLSKGPFINAMKVFADIGAWDEAIAAGETAMQLDPTDSALAADLKDLAAQRAMDKGGYTAAGGAEGGFRKFVKDIDKQRELVESESITGAGSSEERALLRAKQEYEAAPNVPENINRYAQLLKKHGTPELVEQAYQLYLKGFNDTQEYRFRMAAGDIRIEQAEQRIKQLRSQIESNGASEALVAELKKHEQALRALQKDEYTARVEQYPTNRSLRFALGEVLFATGEFEEAMAQFQAAKDEPKLRVKSAFMLGKCFASEHWHQDAVSEFREALEHIDSTERDLELDVRYELMNSLIKLAETDRNSELAREAQEICSTIMRKNITYRDIRARRKEVDALLKDLTAGS